jgi:hypothetical protein
VRAVRGGVAGSELRYGESKKGQPAKNAGRGAG